MGQFPGQLGATADCNSQTGPGLWRAGWLEVESHKFTGFRRHQISSVPPTTDCEGEMTDTWLAMMKTSPILFWLGRILQNYKVIIFFFFFLQVCMWQTRAPPRFRHTQLQWYRLAPFEIAEDSLFNLRNINLHRLNKVGTDKEIQRGLACERLADLAVPPQDLKSPMFRSIFLNKTS